MGRGLKRTMGRESMPTLSIGIVGLGLMGGSLGLDFQSLGHKTYGLVHKESNAQIAMERNLVSVVSTNPSILNNCEIIILSLPIQQLLHPGRELINALPKNAVVTDVGSVKEPVLNVWKDLHPRFVPSHPMAGNEKSGVTSGQIGLFKNKPWVVTPDKSTEAEAIQIIKDLARQLECEWIISEPAKHDEAVALISHLPVLISAALIHTVGYERDPVIKNLSKLLASSGFKDTTRVGGGNPNLGTAMAKYNTSKVLKSLSSYRWSLQQIEEILLSGEWEQLTKELKHAKSIRQEFL